ncbi:FemAB family XrtA/PEP-CTERM system-associated protein [Novosphingobium sp.]|uniref:FemAB family XrtA/PEP-CTERM system-associated protein n=1 Tax=Novosphingobium sp. TaxID=1874826 RepID=UPI0035AF4E78
MNAPFHPQRLALREADFADAEDLRRIEGYVARHAEGTPFHRPAWLVAAARGTGNRACALLAERHGELVGYVPLIEVGSPLFGRVLVSSGFGVGGGLLLDDPRDAGQLFAGLEELAQRRSCPTIELRGGPLPEGRTGWKVRHDSHCGFVAPLAADDEAQLAWIPRKQRAEVRKGLAGDMTVEIGRGEGDRAAHYAVYATSVRNLGTPVFPRLLFDEVLDAFGEDADILTIRDGGVPVASVLSLYHAGAVMPYWGGGTYAARRLRANDRMYFELMLHARRRGCDRFDFGRSKTGSGPYDFKRNWGFEPQPLGYASWTASGAEARDADPTSAKHAARIELWKRLPLPIANLIGPLIARGLG